MLFRSCAFAAALPPSLPTHELKDYALGALARVPGVRVIPPHDAPHIVCFTRPGLPAGVLLRYLSDRGIFVSAGAACGRGHRSPVLTAMGLPVSDVDSALRTSFGPGSTTADVDALTAGLTAAAQELINL